MLDFLSFRIVRRLATYAILAAFLSAMSGPIQANVAKVKGALAQIQAVAR